MRTPEFIPGHAIPFLGGGGALELARQQRRQQTRHRRVLRMRALGMWWYRIVLIVLGGIVAAILGQFTLDYAKYIFAGIAALVLIVLAIRRVEFGLLLMAIVTTAFFPQLFAVKSLAVYAVMPLLLLLFFALLVKAALRLHEVVLPSIWAIWPQLGLITMAIISTVTIQLTWTRSVPRKIGGSPAMYDELLGIALCFIPLIAILVTTGALTKKDRFIEYIQRAYLILAFIAAMVVIIEFKRINATVYTFRYAEPSIFWMKLKGLAQLLCLGAMIAYGRALYATRWRMRLFYTVLLALNLLATYFTLDNSWWLEIGIALIVMTCAYSRRLFVFFCMCALPLLPLLKAELSKLSSVKTADYYRLIIWQDALRVWSKQPLLGVGPGDFWVYDQRFTLLPRLVRNCSATGLCVAHNGYLQVLAEMGPIGLFFWLASIVVIAFLSIQLMSRSPVLKQRGNKLLGFIGLNLTCESEKRYGRMLGLTALGLVCGSAVADFFSGGFFLPARQIDSFQWIPDALSSWVIWGCVIYQDKLWRIARRRSKATVEDRGSPVST